MTVVFKMLQFYFALFLIGFVATSVLPVEKCKLDDSACMTTAFQAALPVFASGIPELEVEVLDPMEMDDLAFELSGLKFSLKQGRLKGLKSATIDKITWDLKKKRINMDYHLDGSVRGKYTAAGRLLILPITGDGDMKLRLKNIAIKMHLDYKMVKDAEGKNYVEPTHYDFDFEVKDNAHFNLTNLFNGNKQLSEPMLLFLNENWKQVSTEFGRPMLDTAAKKLFKNVATFLSKQPIEDISEV